MSEISGRFGKIREDSGIGWKSSSSFEIDNRLHRAFYVVARCWNGLRKASILIVKRLFFSLLAVTMAIFLSVFPSHTALATGGSGNCGWTTYTQLCPTGSAEARRTQCKPKWFGTSTCTLVNCTGVEIDAGENLTDASCNTGK
jgi:hypothetical protein